MRGWGDYTDARIKKIKEMFGLQNKRKKKKKRGNTENIGKVERKLINKRRKRDTKENYYREEWRKRTRRKHKDRKGKKKSKEDFRIEK